MNKYFTQESSFHNSRRTDGETRRGRYQLMEVRSLDSRLGLLRMAGGSSSADQDIYWANVGNTYTVTAEMCSPFNATAGIGESVTVRAHLDGSPKVRDSVLILTNVVQRYELESSVPETILDLYPGQSYQMNTTISNLGNGQDRFDVTIESIIDDKGAAHVWDMYIPRILLRN